MGAAWPLSYDSWIYNYLCNQCLSPLMLWIRILIKASCTALCDKVCQWLATGRWFSPGPPVSSINKTDPHDITEMVLKVALNKINQTNKQVVHVLVCRCPSINKCPTQEYTNKGLYKVKYIFSRISRFKINFNFRRTHTCLGSLDSM